MATIQHSATGTPELSSTAHPSPRLDRLKTPDAEVPNLALGAPALDPRKPRLTECWAHRGASATFPENTLASYHEACKQGAGGIETDNELLLCHDPALERTTDGHGMINDQPWHGVLEHVRTKQSPVQPIPLLSQILDLMLSSGNEHLKLNLDCKVHNDPDKLYSLVRKAVTGVEGWKERLAPRIILGMWHFLLPAATYFPLLPRYVISMSIADARRYFWNSVHGFSMYYEALGTAEGQRFLADCKIAGKDVAAWTVNTKDGMKDCVRWSLATCITDKPDMWREVQAEIAADGHRALKPTLRSAILPWFTKQAWRFDIDREAKDYMADLERVGGRFEDWADVDVRLQ